MSLPNSEPENFHYNPGNSNPNIPSTSSSADSLGVIEKKSASSESTTVYCDSSSNSTAQKEPESSTQRRLTFEQATIASGEKDENLNLESGLELRIHQNKYRTQISRTVTKESVKLAQDQFNHDPYNLDMNLEAQEVNSRPHSLVKRDRYPSERRYPRPSSDASANIPVSRRSERRAERRNLARNLRNSRNLAHLPSGKRSSLPSLWELFSKCVTFYAPNPLLSCCGMKTAEVRLAWREKMALCTIIFILCLAVGFLTFGFQQVLCGFSNNINRVKQGTVNQEDAIIHGKVYQLSEYVHPGVSNAIPTNGSLSSFAGGQDLSFLFQNVNGKCKGFKMPVFQPNLRVIWKILVAILH
ncbi:hypothetical protein K7432_013434 [Basidiobolus ranarum]|uniref:Uncharacterized protein n=1 Tax=Basidiobolus ranarum TaxID=34480 RepID=A0ABR2VR98_9FUNG